MCGIAGLFTFDGRDVETHEVVTMADTLNHRGPDARGSWTRGNVGFGHTRLSIIDLAGSEQPMSEQTGRYTVCFNGEIFNYRQIRSSLSYDFRTGGDTEVLLALFARYGPEGVTRLVGQFAYALHDAHSGDLYLFRDRLGVLPLYYTLDDHRLAFGSEIKALLPVLDGPPTLDREQLAPYLMRRAVPAPRTLLAGVHKLPPGHYLKVSRDGSTSLVRYWSLPEPGDQLSVSAEAAVDLLDAELDNAVRSALVADVPIGSYLSGGVDSSLIVALASRHVPSGSLNTFCASFGDPRFDETAHAATVSRAFDTRHHVVEVGADDFIDLWPALTRNRDAPISEPADIAVFKLAEAARQHVKVVLSGEGSDELFGGYPKYRFIGATAGLGHVPGAAWASATAERWLPAGQVKPRIALRAQTGRTNAERLISWFAPFTWYEAQRLLGADVRPLPDAAGMGRDAIDSMARLDLGAWLPDNLLERGDRMSMAASLELRPPFMDHRLVELAMRMPSAVKVRGSETKWLVKQVAARHLPLEIVQRPKVGFRVPLDVWFRHGLKDMCHDLLLATDSFVGDVFDGAVVRSLVADHESGRRNEEIRLWTLLSLEMWARQYLQPQYNLAGAASSTGVG